jgi:hypothetical protein
MNLSYFEARSDALDVRDGGWKVAEALVRLSGPDRLLVLLTSYGVKWAELSDDVIVFAEILKRRSSFPQEVDDLVVGVVGIVARSAWADVYSDVRRCFEVLGCQEAWFRRLSRLPVVGDVYELSHGDAVGHLSFSLVEAPRYHTLRVLKRGSL